jgi:hypothetical protein
MLLAVTNRFRCHRTDLHFYRSHVTDFEIGGLCVIKFIANVIKFEQKER